MNKETLIAAGFTEEQATNIMKMHQQAIDGHYVPKATFDAERDKVKNLTTQVADRDKQITELGTFKGTAEQLQSKVAELEKQTGFALSNSPTQKVKGYLLDEFKKIKHNLI